MAEVIYKMDELAVQVGGMFALVTLVNMRMRQIKNGARPLVQDSLQNLKQVVLKEIAEEKVSLKLNDEGDYELLYEDDDAFFLED